MAKALITYASMSGNTEDIAGIIKDTLQEYSLDIDCIDMDDAEASALTSYDYVLIGTYTWGDGDLPYEAEDFFEEVQQLQLNGLKTACFGSGITLIQSFAKLSICSVTCCKRRELLSIKKHLKLSLPLKRMMTWKVAENLQEVFLHGQTL